MSAMAGAGSPRSRLNHAMFAAALMVGTFFAAIYLTPSRNWFDQLGRPELDQIVPHEFGDWKDTGHAPLVLVNPEQGEQLRIIYNQTLSRTYIHQPTGRVLMLSVAHGKDQAYSTQLHRPEMCYRAQGFNVLRQEGIDLPTTVGTLPISRLWTRAGSRNEPVSYWIRTGSRVTRGSTQMNLERIALALRGYVADGVLFRVSEVTRDDASSFDLQAQFMSDMLRAIPEVQRPMLIGRGAY